MHRVLAPHRIDMHRDHLRCGNQQARDNAGQWYDVLFDGPLEYGEQVDPDLCDGCGQVWYRGEPLGEACVDFSHLLDWSGRPW